MKAWLSIILFVLLILVSGFAGYFIRKSSERPAGSVTIIERDKQMIRINDSLNFINKRYIREIDSLKILLTAKTKKHVENIGKLDTLPAPAIFRELSEYYGK